MSDLVRRQSSIVSAIQRGRIEKEVNQALAIEDGVKTVMKRRIVNGTELADEGITCLAFLHYRISQRSYERPLLEAQAREVQDTFALDVGLIVHRYMTR